MSTARRQLIFAYDTPRSIIDNNFLCLHSFVTNISETVLALLLIRLRCYTTTFIHLIIFVFIHHYYLIIVALLLFIYYTILFLRLPKEQSYSTFKSKPHDAFRCEWPLSPYLFSGPTEKAPGGNKTRNK